VKFTGYSWDIEWNYSIGIVGETLKIKHGWEIIVFFGGGMGIYRIALRNWLKFENI